MMEFQEPRVYSGRLLSCGHSFEFVCLGQAVCYLGGTRVDANEHAGNLAALPVLHPAENEVDGKGGMELQDWLCYR